VSRQGFYQWRDRPPSQRALDDAALTERIAKIHTAHGRRVGVRRVRDELARAGVTCSHKRTHRLMRAAGLRGVHPRPYKRTTLSGRFDPSLVDLLHRDFAPTAPDLAWVGDITLRQDLDRLGVSGHRDRLFSRRVVGWAIAEHLRTDLITDALRMAIITGIHRRESSSIPTAAPTPPTNSADFAAPTVCGRPLGAPDRVSIMRSPSCSSRPSRRNSSTPGRGRALTNSGPPCSNTSSRTTTGVGGIRQSATTPRSNTKRNRHSHGYKPRNRCLQDREHSNHAANVGLGRRITTDPKLAGMASTLVALLCSGAAAVLRISAIPRLSAARW
jgi:hypothetical protein